MNLAIDASVFVALAAQLGERFVALDRQRLERASAIVTAREPDRPA